MGPSIPGASKEGWLANLNKQMDPKKVAHRITKLAQAIYCEPIELLALIQDYTDVQDIADEVYQILKEGE